MRFIRKLLILVFIFPSQAHGENQIYLLPKFKTIAIADTTIDLIQCLFEQSTTLVEIIEEGDLRVPQLELTETSKGLQVMWKNNHQEDLGIYAYSKAANNKLCSLVVKKINNPDADDISIKPKHQSIEKSIEQSPTPPESNYGLWITLGLGVLASTWLLLRSSSSSEKKVGFQVKIKIP